MINASFRSLLTLMVMVVTPRVSSAALVEIVLVDRLDDPRGFCLDVFAHQQSAIPLGGLQAHTCYSYEGQLGVDQAFDGDLISMGEFRVVEFDVCMTAIETQWGSGIALRDCDGGDAQRFELRPDGEIIPRDAPDLCVTTGEWSVPGGGGDPVHLLRRLTIEPCEPGREAFQRWRLRETFD